jgi:hypothetical protein
MTEESGFVEGQNVNTEYRWAGSRFTDIPADDLLQNECVRRFREIFPAGQVLQSTVNLGKREPPPGRSAIELSAAALRRTNTAFGQATGGKRFLSRSCWPLSFKSWRG